MFSISLLHMLKYCLLPGLLIAMAGKPLYAQSGKPKTPASKRTAPAAAAKKPLRFRSSWGLFLGDTLPRPEVLKLLDSALAARDEMNNKYPVISFDFTYERKEPYLNDTTGRPGFYSEFTGDTFKSDRLPAPWSKSIKESLQSGEVLYFDNIIIRYTGDKLYRVPAMKFTVK